MPVIMIINNVLCCYHVVPPEHIILLSPEFINCRCFADVQNTLGVANKGTVYALFSRKAADSKELTFHEGEQLRIVKKSEGDDQWWCVAENARKKRGLVPLNFMGLKRRHQIIL